MKIKGIGIGFSFGKSWIRHWIIVLCIQRVSTLWRTVLYKHFKNFETKIKKNKTNWKLHQQTLIALLFQSVCFSRVYIKLPVFNYVNCKKITVFLACPKCSASIARVIQWERFYTNSGWMDPSTLIGYVYSNERSSNRLNWKGQFVSKKVYMKW